MLLMLLQKNMQVDEVVFFDTGVEFGAIYDTRARVKRLLRDKNIKFTELEANENFLYKMLEKEVNKRDGSVQKGYGPCRWNVQMGNSRKTKNNKKIPKK